ncbi:MFS transporter [Sphingomonas sp. Leaf22]|uniref:MFS transporter n=1 Tax=Sphingomonas sp. Leaf22 TaxID=1735687 RepID=UPI0006F2DBFC|nr:MFS transporter [Sphingomonas sp. Leaf22]KQM94437.1 MFS transporter [Sphingomonas sp. Leaf22]
MTTTNRPTLGFAQLWNISFGFFGIQIGFALQNANASRIFQSLGTPIDQLGLMWIAAPLTGLLVQPLIGHYSDRTWGRLGRRRPYFLIGAILCTCALFFMPNAPSILAAAMTLWILDASLNVSMEPFRAFVGDMLSPRQRPAGYAFQTWFIGAGAVVASIAPYVFENVFGVSNTAPAGEVPDAVRYGFYFGGVMLLIAVLWTVLTVREYSPAELAAFGEEAQEPVDHTPPVIPQRGPSWIVGGIVVALLIAWAERSGALASGREAYFVAAGVALYGVAQLISGALVRAGRGDNVLSHIIGDLATMPDTMRRLALVQFFTWGALIIMWVYTTPVIAQQVWGTIDPTSDGYNQAGSWVGVLFAIYSGVAAVAAFALPVLARRIGAARTHLLCLAIGSVAYIGIFLTHDRTGMILPMIGIGIAWASVLTMPYVLLANALPQRKLGVYMGIFNFFIVLPQLIVATVMGGVIKTWFPTNPAYTMLVAATVMALAAVAMLRVRDPIAG